MYAYQQLMITLATGSSAKPTHSGGSAVLAVLRILLITGSTDSVDSVDPIEPAQTETPAVTLNEVKSLKPIETEAKEIEERSANQTLYQQRIYRGPFTVVKAPGAANAEVAIQESAETLGGNARFAYAATPVIQPSTGDTLSIAVTYDLLHIIKDHLGSIRAILTSDGNIRERHDYYPFGLRTDQSRAYPTLSDRYTVKVPRLTQGPNGTTTQTGYRATAPYTLQYNGKELQLLANTTLIDYGARQYNPTLARWTAQDPMAEKYYPISPYAYCAGNPINMVDENGEDWYSTTEIDDNGKEETKYHFSEKFRSQEDLDKAGIKGNYLGITYQGNNFYLSLLGDKFEITNKESLIIALMIKNIDKAIENHYYDLFKNRQKSFINTEVSETLTDMNIYLNGKQQNVDLKKKIPYYFNYAGGIVEYNVANHLSFSRFSWGDGVIRKNREFGYWGSVEYSAIAKIYRKHHKNFDVVRWHFFSNTQWRKAKNRADILYQKRF